MNIKKIDLLNYLLIGISFLFGFYLSCGEFILDKDPTRPFAPWEISVVISVLLISFASLLVINILRKKYRPNYIILGILFILFVSNLITILLYKNRGIYAYTGIDGEFCDFKYTVTPFMRFSFIAEQFAMLLMVVLIFDVIHQVVDGKFFLRIACYVTLLVVFILMIISFCKEGGNYAGLITHLTKDDLQAYAVASVFKSKNNYAYILNLGIFATILLHNNDKKWYWLAVSAFLYLNMFFTLCKFLIILDAILILGYLLYRFFVTYKDNKRRNIITIIAVGGSIILVSLIFIVALAVAGKIASFFETLFSVKGYDTLQTRQWIWQKSALAISNSNVVTGDGFGLFGELLFNYNINDWATRAINETRSAHSGYIQYLGEGGILMLALFIVFVGYISYLYFKNMKNNRDLLVISLSFFVFSLIYMIIESGAIIFAKSIEYGGAAVLIFVPLLTVNKEAKEKSN